MRRKPAVSGSFYPNDPSTLIETVKSHIPQKVQKKNVMGVMVPHAGFKYSGDVAGAVYASIEIPQTIVLIGPNHTGIGPPVSVMTEGIWDMPQGPLVIDTKLARAILEESALVKSDSSAHLREHSIEAQIPFIQFWKKDFKIVPICLQKLSLDNCRLVSRTILSGLKKLGRNILIVASSDMSHYETHKTAYYKDKLAIAQILERNPKALFETVNKNRISMCGVTPTAVMLMTANEMGAKNAELIHYTTSGEVSGDMDHVVGYAGVIVH